MKSVRFLVCMTILSALFAFPALVCQADDATDTPAAAATAEFDFTVPAEGTVDDYLTFIDEVQKQIRVPAPPRTLEEYIGRLEKIHPAILGAAEKILANAEATDDQIKTAIEHKFNILVISLQRGNEKAADQIKDFIKFVKAKGLDEMAAALEDQLFQMELQQAIMTNDVETFKAMFDELIAKADAANKEIPTSLAKTMSMVAQYVQYMGDDELAISVSKSIAEKFAQDSNEMLQRIAKSMEGAIRRLALVGNEMLLGGTFVDGSKFNADDYKGKVVLIDFWATWCGPCRAEIPTVKKMYAAYHDKGFEIIGISSDRTKEDMTEFIANEEMTWKQMMRDEALVADGQELGSYYGVTGIPTMILIGKDGKVISIKARGEKLVELLEGIFGKAE